MIGIIVDNFAKLRLQQEAIERDQQNTCFICGLKRRDWERQKSAQDFNQHIRLRHNWQNYMQQSAFNGSSEH